MIEAGQFLSKPGAAITFLSGLGIVGLGLLLWTLWIARRKYVARLVPAITDEGFIRAIGLGGALSIVLTLVLQTLSLVFLGVTVEITGAAANQVGQMRSSSSVPPVAIHGGAHAVQGIGKSLSRNPRAAGVAAVVAVTLILLLVVGAGYAFSAIDLPFLPHFIAYTVGVGLLEECTKAVAGVVVCYWIVQQAPDDTPKGHHRRVMAAFGLAGLGFGAGEAFHYFGVYNELNAGMGWYAVRAIWCVALTCELDVDLWRIIASSLPVLWDKTIDLRKIGGLILVSCIPSMILHGFYDAACLHGSSLCWVTGIVSMIAAMSLFESSIGEETPQVASV